MTQTNQADKRDEYIRELRAIESSLGSAETIVFIQEQNDRDRAKFFDLKSDASLISDSAVESFAVPPKTAEKESAVE